MCRNIVQLRRIDRPVAREEIEAAARQYVRKVSGFRTPSRANEAAFEAAVTAVTTATARLLKDLDVRGQPKTVIAGREERSTATQSDRA